MKISDELMDILSRDTENPPLSSIYLSIFRLIPKDDLCFILEQYKEIYKNDKEKNIWFYKFHKSIRQSDFIDLPNGGVFDSILWNLIHLDKKDILFNAMERVFKIFL
jgi:hypothetical protein